MSAASCDIGMSGARTPAPAPVAGVIVLGMHRSGTSAATRLVNMLGLHTCPQEDMVKGLNGNPKGHWESQSLVDLNDRVLDDMGRTWWCPPPAPGVRYDEAARQIHVPLDEAAAAFDRLHPPTPWVWKDPRTPATLPFWEAALARPFTVVALLRNPLDVAGSLRARNRFPTPLGVAMWERYNRLLLSHLTGHRVLLGRYDDMVDDPVTWAAALRGFLAGAGLPVAYPQTGACVESFVQKDLRHSRHGAEEVERFWPSANAVLEALEQSVGVHEAFTSPELPPEEAWVEAELVAIGARQARPLPRPARPTVTVISEDPSAWAPPVALAYRELAGLEVDGRPRGERRNQAVCRSAGEILVFCAPGVRVSENWWPELRRALAAGHSAVGPAVLTAADQRGYGMTWHDRWLNRQWIPGPERVDTVAGAAPRPAPFIPDGCWAVTRAAFEEIGGFDPALGAFGLDTDDVCLRLWRSGHSCAVVPSVLAELPPDDPGAAGGWPAFLHDLIRMASIHLDAEDCAYVFDSLRTTDGFVGAAAAVAQENVGSRRQLVEQGARFSTSEVCERLGIVIDPMKAVRAARRSTGEGSGTDAGECPQGHHTLVLVGGLHGSGLGVVTRLLASHPLVSAVNGTGATNNEGQHLQDVYPAAKELGGPGRFALHPDAHMHEGAHLVSPVMGRRLFGQWSPNWDLSRPVLIEKSPPNLVRTRFLQALFPGSRFVMVQRHPVAVALQTTSSPLADMDTLLENWLAGWERFEADRGHLDAALVVGYEDLLADPQATTDHLAGFLGLEGLSAAGLVDSGAQRETEQLWQAAVEAGGPAWLESLTERFGERAAAFGYRLDDPCAADVLDALPVG